MDPNVKDQQIARLIGEEQMDEEEQSLGPMQCVKPREDIMSLPAREYLDLMVTPVLIEGLKALDHEGPEDPISFLAAYLLKNRRRANEVVAPPDM
ncbi:protein dpy-30 homolog [Teleopsis dalmanni]|uniref:protein dpy-30 homolog n=1 Tax=Teleopsis dalmanni TaxID=139649 RepID=UPI0018CEECAC|nr:protein dpy-30 homolog [Teleopsis dalmanni]